MKCVYEVQRKCEIIGQHCDGKYCCTSVRDVKIHCEPVENRFKCDNSSLLKC